MKLLLGLCLGWLAVFASTANAYMGTTHTILTQEEKQQFIALSEHLVTTPYLSKEQFIHQLEDQLRAANKPSEQLKIAYQLALYSNQVREYKKLSEYGQQLSQLATQANDELMSVLADIFLIIAKEQNNYFAIRQQLTELLKPYQSVEDLRFNALIDIISNDQSPLFEYVSKLQAKQMWFELFILYWELTNRELWAKQSLEYHQNLLSLSQAHEFPVDKHTMNFNLVLYLSSFLYENETALEVSNNYVAQSAISGNAEEIFYSHLQKAEILSKLERFEEANQTFLQAKLYLDTQSERAKAEFSKKYTTTLLALGKTEQAQQTIQFYLEYQENGAIFPSSSYMRIKAYFHFLNGEVQQGIPLIEKSAAKVNAHLIRDSYERLVELKRLSKREIEINQLAQRRLENLQATMALVLLFLVISSSLFLRQRKLALRLSQANVELERIARTDGLTGVNNRLYWEELRQAEFDRLKRGYSESDCHLMIDIDHFKAVNDSFGHSVGDTAIQKVAAVIKQNLRSVDIIGRYGGEEFAVILPETELQQAKSLAERIREKVELLTIATDGEDISLTVSVGVAQYSAKYETAERWTNDADKALYLAKENGRNLVQIYSPNPHSD